MARTKKQTLENASERKRLIQEEILRESLAAKQKAAAAAPAVDTTSQPSASASARSRSKGKQRSRHAQPSPNGVAPHDSPSSSRADTPVSVKATDRSFSSKRKKAETSRGSSKSNDRVLSSKGSCQVTPSSRDSESKAAVTVASSTKGDMPKAVLCIPDIYSSPSSSSGGNSKNSPSMDKTLEAAVDSLDTGGGTISTPISKTPSSGSRKDSPGSVDQCKQKTKKGQQDSVKASLMSLKATSEMVREEKRRTSRQRSPGSSKEESPGSQNPSPERRSPRNHSPSNSTDALDAQQNSVTGKKRAKQKTQLEERPKINIFTDNIGVELGKRVRSPRRLSEDMIALPIFSARRWSSSPREASYIAEKSDCEGASAKLSLEDQEPFKPPPAVSPNPPVAKGSSSVPSKKKNSFSDKSNSYSATASDETGKEDETPVRKKQSQKVKNKQPLLTFEGGDDNECIANKKKQKKKRRSKLEPSANVVGASEDKEEKLIMEAKDESRKEKPDKKSSDCEKDDFGPHVNANVKDEEQNENNDRKEGDFDSEKPIPDDPVVLSQENCTGDDICKDNTDPGNNQNVKSESPHESDTKHAMEAILDEDQMSTDTSQSPERALVSKSEDVRKKEESAQKSQKKLKGKSFVRTASGERKKKQREKMKIRDEVLTSICSVMSGVVITPSDSLENKALTKSDHQALSEDSDQNQNKSQDLPKNLCSKTTSVAMSPSSGLFNQTITNVGMSPQKELGASPSPGLLQPAKNILMTPPSVCLAPTTPVVTSTCTAAIAPSTYVSAASSSTSSPTITACTSHSLISTPVTLSTKPVFGHQPSKLPALSSDVDPPDSPACDTNNAGSTQNVTGMETEPSYETLPDGDITKHSTDSSKEETTLDLNEPLPVQKKVEENILSLDVKSSGSSEVSSTTEEKAILSSETQLNVDTQETKPLDDLQSTSIVKDEMENTRTMPADTELNISSSTEHNQAKAVIHKSPILETAEATSSNLAKTISKESPQSSLLCAMLVGGSEVAYTYEKSKPSVAGTPLSLDTDNSPQLNAQPSVSEEKPGSKQYSTSSNSDTCKEKLDTRTEDNTSNANCELLTEKGDAPSSHCSEEKSSAEPVDDVDIKKEDLMKSKKTKAKKDLKIDIVSKLREVDDTVLKLIDIDTEETFLDSKFSESELSLCGGQKSSGPENLENVQLDSETERKPEKIGMDDEVLETPLYGVISNLATRLKGITPTVDVEEMLESCPKHMLKLCTQVDEEARWSSLKLRLKEEIEESNTVASVKNDPTVAENPSLSSAVSTDVEMDRSNQNMPCANIPEESAVTESSCDEKGEISSLMTSSSSTNNSLCELDPDAMTLAVNDACLDVSIDCPLKAVKDEPDEQDSTQGPELDKESPGKFLIQKSKTFEFPNPLSQEHKPTPLRRVNSSPQLKVESPGENMKSESLSDSGKLKDLHMSKSKLGSKIPVPGTSYVSKTFRKTWRTPRIILEPKPLTVLSELEELSDSKKNIFTCPNLQKYLNVPSNRVIVPPHKKKEMQILDERAKKVEADRETNMAERSDKERLEEMINIEYLKYEPDFDEVDGLLFMSFTCEAELTAHSRVEKALEWDKDDTMLRIAQAKAFEEAKHLKAGMEAVKFKHLRGQHMRWKKYRRLYSSEVKSILNGAPSGVEENLRREAVSRASSRKTSDVSKIKNWKSKTGVARQHLQIHRQKAREWKLARKEKLKSKKLKKSTPPRNPTHSLHIPPTVPSAEDISQFQDHLEAKQGTSAQFSPQLLKSELESGADGDTPLLTRSKKRKGFSHQKEHKQLFKELNMDWEDRMIHRKLGGWSLKGNRPKAFSQAAHKREEKQKLLLCEEGPSSVLPLPDSSPLSVVENLSPGSSNTPSRVSSSVDISSPSKDDVDSHKKKKSLKLVYPLLTERMARNALAAMINLRGGGHKNDDIDGNNSGQSSRKSRHKLKVDELPALLPILPHPASSHGSSVILFDGSGVLQRPLWHTPPIVQLVSPGSSLVAAIGSPALSDPSMLESNAATPLSSLSLAANAASSIPSSPSPLQSKLSSATNTPSTLAGTESREDAMVMEGVDTVADMVSSPSIADSASTKSCGKPGCRYGCICHLCSVSASSTSPVGKSLTSTCDKEYCRLGCICDSLDPEKPIPEASHCRQPSCMLGCVCSPVIRTDRESAKGMNNNPLRMPERLNKRKAKLKHRNRDLTNGSDCDNIPYLPSMKRKPPNERFSNLPQREKTHRSAKNLDAVTRKAMMLYETSEIYCEKTERPPRKDQKDIALGLSGTPIDDDFSFITSAIAKPVIEIDSPPEEDSLMPFEGDRILKHEGESSGTVAAASYSHDLRLPAYPDTYDHSEGEDDVRSEVPSAMNINFEDFLLQRRRKALSLALEEERQTLPILEQSTHKRKRKSHPLSSEIFTLSTCARTQPYKYKRKQKEAKPSHRAPDSAASSLMRFTPIQAHSHTQSGSGQPAVPAQGNSSASSSNIGSSLLKISPAEPQVSGAQSQGQEPSQVPLRNAQESSVPTSMYNRKRVRTGSIEAGNRNRFQQSWHTSMVCLKARGPPPKKKRVSSELPAEGEDEEEDVQEEDEVKLLEFLANCNWEGARKEILGKVAQCLTRGQYPQPRTMKICEFLVEILPKAHKPSVIPEELRKKLPGKMYSIRVRVTRREILPRPPLEDDGQVIDLSESSPVKAYPTAATVPTNVHTSLQPKTVGVSGMSNLSANVGISGLSRMCVTSKCDLNSNQQKSASAPNSRRTSTEVITAAPLTDPSVTDYNIPLTVTQLQKKSSLLQANINMVSAQPSHASGESSKTFVDTTNAPSVPATPVISGVSTLPYPLPAKCSQAQKTIKPRPAGAINTQTRSLLTNKAVSGVTTPTSNIVPFYYTVKPDDLKYMKIQGKDGLMQVVGVSNDNKALVTVPVSAGQKLAAGDQPKGGPMKTCAVPFITVPVCGPHGHKIVPIIPTPPPITSSSLPGTHQSILLRFPTSTQAYPQGVVKGPVLIRPMGSQPQSSKLQPVMISSSPRSLLATNHLSTSKDKSSPQLSDASTPQTQSIPLTAGSDTKPKVTSSDNEMIMTFDIAHIKQKKGSNKTANENSRQNSSDVEKRDKLGDPHTTLVTHSLKGPIMSFEESPTPKIDQQHINQVPSVSMENLSESDKQVEAPSQCCDKAMQQEDTAASKKSCEQWKEAEKHSETAPVSSSRNKTKTPKGPNLYVPNTNPESSSMIMVYPPSNVLTKTSSITSPVVPVTELNKAAPSSELKIPGVSTNSVITTSSSSIATDSVHEQLSLDTVATSTTHSKVSLFTSFTKKMAPEIKSAPTSGQHPTTSPEGPIPSLSNIELSSVPQQNTQAPETNKQGLKRKRTSADDVEESTSLSDIKKGLHTYPDTHRWSPKENEEQDSLRSSADAGVGLTSVGPSLSAASNAVNERPISSMSTSLSTTSSDNLHIMLSSDESDIDVGEAEDPSSIMALRQNAERAIENDHGYPRMALSGSSSPVLVQDRASKALNTKITQVLKNRRKDVDAIEHNLRERIRRSQLKDLFVDLQRNVCKVTGAEFDPNLSRAKTLQQAKSTILQLVEQERDGQQRYQYELQKKNVLLKQREILYSELSKTMPAETIKGIAEQAVKKCKKRRAALALEASRLYETLQDGSSNTQEQSSSANANSKCANAYNTSKAVQKTSLARDQSLESSPLLSQADSQHSVTGPHDHNVGQATSTCDSQCSKDSVNSGGNLAQTEPVDTVDLISNSSSADCEQGSVEAYQGSPSPAKYEDISEPEEDTTVPAPEAQASAESSVTTVSKSEAQEAPQSAQCYEDISDVEESKLPKYEDISDSEEAVGVRHSDS